MVTLLMLKSTRLPTGGISASWCLLLFGLLVDCHHGSVQFAVGVLPGVSRPHRLLPAVTPTYLSTCLFVFSTSTTRRCVSC